MLQLQIWLDISKSIQNNEGIFVTQDISYWVAAHLTGIFQIKDEYNDLLRCGSRGAGVSINRGVITTVRKSKNSSVKYFFNGIETERGKALVSSKVVEILIPRTKQTGFRLDYKFEIPISSGYGASAAGAVGTTFAINDLFDLGLSDLELFQVAHKAEVLTKSGLGDVIGLFQGGLEIRIKEGAPGIGKTIPIIDSDNWKIATVHLGPLITSKILSNPQKREAVNVAGEKLIINLISNPTIENFILSAAEFTEKVNLWSSRLKKYIKSLPKNIIGAQIMLGESLFLFYQRESDLKLSNIPHNMINKETICQQPVLKCEQ